VTNFALVIDFTNEKSTVLAALRTLQTLDTASHYAHQYRVRHPLGIYSISISRITYRTKRLCDLLCEHFSTRKAVRHQQTNLDRMLEDYLELLIYALAEHVDDCEMILKTLFQDEEDFGRNKLVRKFKGQIKPFLARFLGIMAQTPQAL
jgi:hypothetical protein